MVVAVGGVRWEAAVSPRRLILTPCCPTSSPRLRGAPAGLILREGALQSPWCPRGWTRSAGAWTGTGMLKAADEGLDEYRHHGTWGSSPARSSNGAKADVAYMPSRLVQRRPLPPAPVCHPGAGIQFRVISQTDKCDFVRPRVPKAHRNLSRDLRLGQCGVFVKRRVSVGR